MNSKELRHEIADLISAWGRTRDSLIVERSGNFDADRRALRTEVWHKVQRFEAIIGAPIGEVWTPYIEDEE